MLLARLRKTTRSNKEHDMLFAEEEASHICFRGKLTSSACACLLSIDKNTGLLMRDDHVTVAHAGEHRSGSVNRWDKTLCPKQLGDVGRHVPGAGPHDHRNQLMPAQDLSCTHTHIL